MIVAGLTGGIASGKSTVSAFLSDAGAKIVDADNIAREAVDRGKPAWEAIAAHFGREVLLADGRIDRKRLGDIVFNDPRQKERLDAIVHPEVMAEVARQLQQVRDQSPEAVVILDVPLLIETRMHEGMAEIIVVYIPETLQVARLMKRDGLGRKDALARIRSQMPIEEKKAYATLLIDNSGSLQVTEKQCLEIYRHLKDGADRTLNR